MINVLALAKDDERYIWLYDDESLREAVQSLGRFASNPDLSLTWYDAAALANRIRQEASKVTTKELAVLVGKMRHAQKEYFRTRSNDALDAAKGLERQVDKACKSALDEQGTLFDED